MLLIRPGQQSFANIVVLSIEVCAEHRSCDFPLVVTRSNANITILEVVKLIELFNLLLYSARCVCVPFYFRFILDVVKLKLTLLAIATRDLI